MDNADNALNSRVLMERYQQCRPLYEDFARTVAELLGTLLEGAHIRVHSITWRAKEPTSLHRKLESTPGKYGDLANITDLAGVRVTTYYPDEVDHVAALVRKEFDVNWHHSIDKRELLDPDRFG